MGRGISAFFAHVSTIRPFTKMAGLLVVGAGLTGSVTTALLNKAPLRLPLTVWDKARGVGGRMTTHRGPNPNLHVDMGAQYISKTRATQGDQEWEDLRESLYKELISNKVLSQFCGPIEGVQQRFTESIEQNYVCPEGINGIVKHFLSQSGAELLFQHHITEISTEVDGLTRKQRVRCNTSSNKTQMFDAVVLTLPVPQLLSLKGDIMESISADIHSKLSTVKYSSRYAVGLFFNEHISTSWSAKYLDDSIIRYASWDTAKRDCTLYGSSLALHTTVPYGINHLEDGKDEVMEEIIQRAIELIPGLPRPAHSHVIRWKYSQVSTVYPGSPGCVVLSHDPLVVATGDGFSGSNFENCIRAAQATAKTFTQLVNSHSTLK